MTLKMKQVDVKPLNKFYADYRFGRCGLRELESEICKLVLANPMAFGLTRLTKKDDCCDFLGWFYPRLRKIISNYQPEQAQFETYIKSLLRYASIEYHVKAAKRCLSDSTIWKERVYECEDSDENLIDEPNEHGDKEDKKNKELNLFIPAKKERDRIRFLKRILFLVLKTYYCVSDQIVECLARETGINQKNIYKMIERLKDMRAYQEKEINYARDNCSRLYPLPLVIALC